MNFFFRRRSASASDLATGPSSSSSASASPIRRSQVAIDVNTFKRYSACKTPKARQLLTNQIRESLELIDEAGLMSAIAKLPPDCAQVLAEVSPLIIPARACLENMARNPDTFGVLLRCMYQRLNDCDHDVLLGVLRRTVDLVLTAKLLDMLTHYGIHSEVQMTSFLANLHAHPFVFVQREMLSYLLEYFAGTPNAVLARHYNVGNLRIIMDLMRNKLLFPMALRLFNVPNQTKQYQQPHYTPS